jgi:hypothetical protein
MFQAVPPPIIRSSNCTYSFWYCQTLLLPAAIMVGMELKLIYQYATNVLSVVTIYFVKMPHLLKQDF